MATMNEIITTKVLAPRGFKTELFYNWLSYIKDSSPKTQETYTRNIRQFIYFLAANRITNPTRDNVIEYRDSLLSTKNLRQ